MTTVEAPLDLVDAVDAELLISGARSPTGHPEWRIPRLSVAPLDPRSRKYSRFADVPHPQCGQLVRVVVGADNFIRQLQVLDGTEASASSLGLATAPVSNTARVGRPLAPDRTAVRLAVLQAAADFCGRFAGAREDAKSEHVLPLAERWLRWVEASEEQQP
jgi:hypothetical protein